MAEIRQIAGRKLGSIGIYAYLRKKDFFVIKCKILYNFITMLRQVQAPACFMVHYSGVKIVQNEQW